MCIGSKRDKSKHCQFHHDYGHDTDECFELKEEIEAFIQRGQQRQFVSRPYKCNERLNNVKQLAQREEGGPKLVKEIKIIMRGPSKFGTSHNSRKGCIREVRQSGEHYWQGQSIETVNWDERPIEVSLAFTDADIQGA